MHYRISFFIIAIATLCGCSNHYNGGDDDAFSADYNTDIALLREVASEGCYTITSDVVCVGRVTSSDLDGNFYRSLFVEDESGSVEVLLGTYNIASQYPIGLLVALHLNGTAVMVQYGVVRVGLPPRSYDSSPREMESQVVIDKHLIRSNGIAKPTAKTYNIEELQQSLCGNFIRVEELEYATDIAPKEEGMAGYRPFTDDKGDVIYSSISEYSNFADMAIPLGRVAIEGVLSYKVVGGGEGRQYVITPRSKDDFKTTDSNN